MKLLLLFGGTVAAVGLFLLATASSDTTLFAGQYPLLLALNAGLAALLAVARRNSPTAATVPPKSSSSFIARPAAARGSPPAPAAAWASAR